jgi:parallel beta-helix repeat (two copies)
MRVRQSMALAGATGLTVLTALTTLTGSSALAMSSAAGGSVLVVPPGQSVQQVVDRAKPGDTVFLSPGTHRGSIQVRTDRLTIAGAGGLTEVVPGPAGGGSECATGGHGICVMGTPEHPVTGVRILSLAVSGFTKDGIMATRTDGMVVRDVLSRDNGEHGIRQDRSVRGVFVDNDATGNAETGIFLANTVSTEGGATDAKGATVRGNRVSGNRIGITVRRLRNLTVERNTVTGNCGGVFVVGDEGTPRGGDLSVRDNRVFANNRSCPASSRLPAIQGVGILLTGVEKTRVTGNDVRDNRGRGESPMSGGIVLFPSAVGVANSHNIVSGNRVRGNLPADIADRDKGTDNSFSDNCCGLSAPAGHC